MHSNSKLSVDDFNKFFVNVGKDTVEAIDDIDVLAMDLLKEMLESIRLTCYLSQCTTKEIKYLFKAIKNKEYLRYLSHLK